jgi:hypothetical protein
LISRKTAYKNIERYIGTGLEGLSDRSRSPCRRANQLPFQIEAIAALLLFVLACAGLALFRFRKTLD